MAKQDKYQGQPESNSESIEEIKRKRREAGEAALREKKPELDHRDEFRKFFAKISGKLRLGKDMEQIIWLHLTKTGFAEKDKFEDGLKNFGYKL